MYACTWIPAAVVPSQTRAGTLWPLTTSSRVLVVLSSVTFMPDLPSDHVGGTAALACRSRGDRDVRRDGGWLRGDPGVVVPEPIGQADRAPSEVARLDA